MSNSPQAESRPQVEVYFPELDDGVNYGINYLQFEFKALLNNGYIIKLRLNDPNFSLNSKLIDEGYLQRSRREDLTIRFKIKAGAGEQPFPEKSTEFQTAIITNVVGQGDGSDDAALDFYAIDPPTFWLSRGKGSGAVYNGKLSEVIENIVEEYAPDVELDISETTDNDQNKWAMMRQDPKSFISSVVDWSSSITSNKTHWIIAPNGNELTIKEQAELESTRRGYYRCWDGAANNTIAGWSFVANNFLSNTNKQIITQGLSAVSGQYLDRITDEDKAFVFANDSNTANKQVPKVAEERSFTKPDEDDEFGVTSYNSIPEVYSAGDIGLRYEDYIDGNARNAYLNVMYKLFNLKISVLGHGEWWNNIGLGVDTVYLKWMSQGKDGEGRELWFLSGNRLVYGFHHMVNSGGWYTDLYLSRYDYDAEGTEVGGDAPD